MKHRYSLGMTIAAFFLSASLFPQSMALGASPACLVLSSDLGYGQADSASSKAVTQLQRFLADSNYFSAIPNGYFGPATQSAVRAFQSSQKISATGFVGPATRAAIGKASCAAGVTQPASTPAPVTTSVGSVFSAPSVSRSIELGSTYTIRWTVPAGGPYSIVLEDDKGVSKGFASYSAGSAGQYTWDVGSVYVSGSDRREVVGPGTYRLRLQGTPARGISEASLVSESFQITLPVTSVKSVLPSSVRANGTSAAVLHGSGFTEGTTIYMGDSYRNGVTTLYYSPEGTIIVFSVPSTIAPGTYPIVLRDRYDNTFTTPVVITVK